MTNRIRFTWRVLQSERQANAAASFLRLSKDLLPEALPVAFGSDDPPSNPMTPSGVDFIKMWESSERFGWETQKPFGYGSAFGFGNSESDKTSTSPALAGLTMRCDAPALLDEAYRAKVRSYFALVSNAIGAFIGVAEVERRGSTNPGIGGQSFYGLPIGDLWLMFVDNRYQTLLHDHLSLESAGDGWIFENQDAWARTDRTGEDSLLSRVPADLLQLTGSPRKPGHTEIRLGAQLHPAPTIPSGLG